MAYLKRGKLWLSVQPYMVKNSFSRQNILKLDGRHRPVLMFLLRQYGTPRNNYLSPVPAAPAARIEHSLTNHFFLSRFLGQLWHRAYRAKMGSQRSVSKNETRDKKYFIVGISTLVSRNIGRHLLKRKVDLQFLMEKWLTKLIVLSRYRTTIYGYLHNNYLKMSSRVPT